MARPSAEAVRDGRATGANAALAAGDAMLACRRGALWRRLRTFLPTVPAVTGTLPSSSAATDTDVVGGGGALLDANDTVGDGTLADACEPELDSLALAVSLSTVLLAGFVGVVSATELSALLDASTVFVVSALFAVSTFTTGWRSGVKKKNEKNG